MNILFDSFFKKFKKLTDEAKSEDFVLDGMDKFKFEITFNNKTPPLRLCAIITARAFILTDGKDFYDEYLDGLNNINDFYTIVESVENCMGVHPHGPAIMHGCVKRYMLAYCNLNTKELIGDYLIKRKSIA